MMAWVHIQNDRSSGHPYYSAYYTTLYHHNGFRSCYFKVINSHTVALTARYEYVFPLCCCESYTTFLLNISTNRQFLRGPVLHSVRRISDGHKRTHYSLRNCCVILINVGAEVENVNNYPFETASFSKSESHYNSCVISAP